MKIEEIEIGGIYASVLSPGHRFQVLEKLSQTCCGGTQHFVLVRGCYNRGLSTELAKLGVAELMPMPSDATYLQNLLHEAKHEAVSQQQWKVAEMLRSCVEVVRETAADSVSESEETNG